MHNLLISIPRTFSLLLVFSYFIFRVWSDSLKLQVFGYSDFSCCWMNCKQTWGWVNTCGFIGDNSLKEIPVLKFTEIIIAMQQCRKIKFIKCRKIKFIRSSNYSYIFLLSSLFLSKILATLSLSVATRLDTEVPMGAFSDTEAVLFPTENTGADKSLYTKTVTITGVDFSGLLLSCANTVVCKIFQIS